MLTKNRQRLLDHEVGARFQHAIVLQARKARLMSIEHFSVDGTLIESLGVAQELPPQGR